MHPLLSRQLRRHLPPGTTIPDAWSALFDAVSATYTQADAEMAMVEHSLDTVSREMLDRYARLEAHKEHQATLEAEKARAEEVALLAGVQLAVARATSPEALLPEVLAAIAAGTGACVAVLWLRATGGWEVARRWQAKRAPTDTWQWRGVDPAAVDAGASATSVPVAPPSGWVVRTLAIDEAPDDQARLDFLVPTAGAALLRDELAAVLARQLSAAMREQRAAQAVHAQAELLRAIGAGTVDALTAKDASGRHLLCNDAAARLYARAPGDVVGRTDAELCDAETAACIHAEDEEVMRRGTSVEIERRWRLGDSIRYLRVRKAPLRGRAGEIVGVVSIASDVTERVLMEQRLHSAQKMEALGLMAGGVAHDFNNLLTVISGHGSLLLTESLSAEDRLASAREICAAADRAAAVIRQLLTFARRRVVRPMALDLHAFLHQRTPMLRGVLGASIDLRLHLHPTPLRARFDASQFDQVLLNLMLNARGALPRGGTVRVTTDAVTVDAEQAAALATSPGEFVALHVTDDGVGMDDATRARVFEPFFTTKPLGEGSGLGLSFVYGAIAQGGGATTVESAPGRGSTFTILLPATSIPGESLEDVAEAVLPEERPVAD